MINISLRQLRYFEALAAHGHFGRAAEACAISQPALSLQIKELEETLGAPLVERGPRQIKLTMLGEMLVLRARNILLAVEEVGELARTASKEISGPLRLGMIPTIAPYLFPDTIHALRKQFTNLELIPRESKTKTLVEELKAGRLDLAIMALPLSDPALHKMALFDEEFLLVRPASHKSRPAPRLDKLHEASLLLLEEGHCFRDQALDICNIDPTGSTSLMEGNSLSTLVQMVDAEIGLSLIPEMALPIETRSAQVCISRFEQDQPTRTIGAFWRKTNPLSKHFEKLANVIAGLKQPDDPSTSN